MIVVLTDRKLPFIQRYIFPCAYFLQEENCYNYIIEDWMSIWLECLSTPFILLFSSKCSGWAIVTGLCPSSFLRRPSCVNFLLLKTSSLKPLIGFWPNFTGMIPRWSPTKVVGRSFYIWYIASSRSPLPKLFKLCPWGQNWPRPGGHNFTLNYIWKTANDFFSWTANGNLTKVTRNGPCVVPYRNCLNGSDWLHK